MVKDILGISGTTTGTTTNDKTKPVITFPNQPTIGPTSVSITWTTDELSSSQVEYGKTADSGVLSPLQDDPTTGETGRVVTHSVTLTSLEPNTTYYYKVMSKDEAGNEAVSSDKTFMTTAAAD
jgi:phosphodiesterase/alkaline phosphatase D-like protein